MQTATEKPVRRFTNSEGRSFTVTLNVWVLKRVRTELGINLLDLGAAEAGDALLGRILGDPVLMVDILWVVVGADSEIEPEAFYRAMSDDAVDQATRALLESLADFYPSPRDRARARKVLGILSESMERAHDVMDRMVSDGTVKRQIDAVIESTLGSTSTAAPGSSASTPAPSPSGS